MKNIFENIDDLLNHLEKNHSNEFSYRGQTQHYDSIIPSYYRNMLDGTSFIFNGKKYYTLKTDDLKKEYLENKFNIEPAIRYEVIKNYGLGIGSILSQQYGLNSEALDITLDPKIAAFFATKKYPRYEHYLPNPKNEIGVIYRFPINKTFKRLDRLDLHLMSGGVTFDINDKFIQRQLEENNSLGIFEEPNITAWYERLHTKESLTQKEIERYFDKYGKKEEDLFSPTTHLSPFELFNFLLEFKIDNTNISKKQLHATRISRQKGGFIIPSTLYSCITPLKQQSIMFKNYLTNKHYFNLHSALIKYPKGVVDLIDYTGLEIFYFKHTPKNQIDFENKYIWPDEKEDKIFGELARNSKEYNAIKMNLIINSVRIEDYKNGVFKKGYEKN